jgi:hypothetical protein
VMIYRLSMLPPWFARVAGTLMRRPFHFNNLLARFPALRTAIWRVHGLK